ncbi:Gluconate transport-inducing protein [Coemansia interrupta]|uniref:Gluconate transport-inducing protein n=1 Tax=Coemansia interrupta TaxID=1126814 RepID=A0A9W8HIQ7_9FUNG|nr:Gluconate transport-inducing protein [Coemansia interrupta]
MGSTRMETYYGFVSTSEDALALFEACRLGYKQRVPRRLSDDERAAIRSGSVFVWEETESGMKRWTDGRSWSPSRVQGCFLTYHEWEGRRRAQRHPSYHTMHGFNMPMNIQGMPGQPFPMGIARYGHFIGGPTKAGSTQVQYGFPKENGMLKKALSIRTTDGMKLHIIAYYSKEDHAMRRLLTPTTDPNFPRLAVPPNLYPDMSPEAMYGAGHTIHNPSMTNEPDYMGPATADPANLQAYEESMAGHRGGGGQDMSGIVGDGSGRGSVRDMILDGHPRSAHPISSMAMDISSDMQHPGMRSPPASASAANISHHYPQHPYMHRRPSSPSAHLHMPSISATPLRDSAAKAKAAAAAASARDEVENAVDAISAGLNKARVQSLVMDSNVPIPSSLLAAASRPAPEQPEMRMHPSHPMSAPSSSGTRPSSNSFSGERMARGYRGHQAGNQQSITSYERPLGLSTSSSSAPASSITRPSGAPANLTLPIEPHGHNYRNHQIIVSEATAMQARSAFELCGNGNDGSTDGGAANADRSSATRSSSISSGTAGYPTSSMADHSNVDEMTELPPMPNTAVPVSNASRGSRYLGLGGPLGLSGINVRRSNTMRSVTTAAVMVNNSSGHGMTKLPLLLSPINLPQIPNDTPTTAYSSINLAGISRDVKEGPRRLPSISASLQPESPPETACTPGGLGIYNAGISSSRGSSSSLLPSPMPTPRQSISRGFDGTDGVSSHSQRQPQQQRSHANSLSILASAADRAQVRHVSSSHRSTNHPYLRNAKRGPSMRSVSLKQSEDIRQLGALDQILRLK